MHGTYASQAAKNATGNGKSVTLNLILCSLRPEIRIFKSANQTRLIVIAYIPSYPPTRSLQLHTSPSLLNNLTTKNQILSRTTIPNMPPRQERQLHIMTTNSPLPADRIRQVHGVPGGPAVQLGLVQHVPRPLDLPRSSHGQDVGHKFRDHRGLELLCGDWDFEGYRLEVLIFSDLGIFFLY